MDLVGNDSGGGIAQILPLSIRNAFGVSRSPSLFPAGFVCADGACIDHEGNIFAVWVEAGQSSQTAQADLTCFGGINNEALILRDVGSFGG